MMRLILGAVMQQCFKAQRLASNEGIMMLSSLERVDGGLWVT